jgi:DNA-binding CsgD family transcriptional regulator
MGERAPSTDLAEAMRAGHRHACAFVRTPEEEFAVLIPFIMDGLDRGEKFWHIVDPGRRSELARRLDHAGVDATALQRSGQLDVSTWQEAYLRGGHFDQRVMLDLVDGTFAANQAQGYARTRLWANMEWAVSDAPWVGDVAAYEARFNDISQRREDLTVCVYDVSRHGADVVADALRTHPLVILDGRAIENRHFTTGDDFLSDLRQRGAPAPPLGPAAPTRPVLVDPRIDQEPSRLTPHERELAGLVAAGLTDGEIAARLGLERGAVADDLNAISARLGLRRRPQVAAWTTARGLYRPRAARALSTRR